MVSLSHRNVALASFHTASVEKSHSQRVSILKRWEIRLQDGIRLQPLDPRCEYQISYFFRNRCVSARRFS